MYVRVTVNYVLLALFFVNAPPPSFVGFQSAAHRGDDLTVVIAAAAGCLALQSELPTKGAVSYAPCPMPPELKRMLLCSRANNAPYRSLTSHTLVI